MICTFSFALRQKSLNQYFQKAILQDSTELSFGMAFRALDIDKVVASWQSKTAAGGGFSNTDALETSLAECMANSGLVSKVAPCATMHRLDPGAPASTQL